ncbi:hypothetical protein GTA62_15915 [Roseobacter sp. HKCCD9010]|uniref:hypothetical protein n=1 Tax=unclassified Roseobacter TaxID=196798 RepID=UPI001491CC7A|nr:MULTISPECIES: hypothetical protein [unclassified Roseobacter]MBF9050407.1 hypothetical protein [Rhodobacterales bacterium HKCCD4356]NNV12176.1 hypothetical protein [Roseobacter sp. HKCCD7357]NNV17190.1 hypothetical protein [Roseobacter sp. HKCCD8768]NNV26419.1 hypothetical protein [Roseobacter sp. HKCCD8192]NNV30914.1 hypothetical protein [Roseobacter sp. HKCCD9061]
MPTEFLDAQQQMINMLGILLIVPVIGLILYITILLAFERQHRLGRSALLLALCLVFGGIAYSERYLKSAITQPLAAAEIASYAAQALSDGPDGPLSEFRYESRVFMIILDVPPDKDLASVASEMPPQELLYRSFCRSFGRLFSGPVDRLDLIGRNATESYRLRTFSREECRTWYLLNRVASRRPLELPPHWPAPSQT